MMAISIVTRKLKPGKTYEDFRKVWFHQQGFATSCKLFTMVNAFDANEITIIAFTETSLENAQKLLEIDIQERLSRSLDDIIEPGNIQRKFGLLAAEDDFSATGDIDYTPAAVNGKKTDFNQFFKNLEKVNYLISEASGRRDQLKNEQASTE